MMTNLQAGRRSWAQRTDDRSAGQGHAWREGAGRRPSKDRTCPLPSERRLPSGLPGVPVRRPRVQGLLLGSSPALPAKRAAKRNGCNYMPQTSIVTPATVCPARGGRKAAPVFRRPHPSCPPPAGAAEAAGRGAPRRCAAGQTRPLGGARPGAGRYWYEVPFLRKRCSSATFFRMSRSPCISTLERSTAGCITQPSRLCWARLEGPEVQAGTRCAEYGPS